MFGVFISSLKKQTGKTVIAGGIAGVMQSLNYSVGYYKPIHTGSETLNGFPKSSDTVFINKIDSNILTFSTYSFESPKSPITGAYESDIKRIKIHQIMNDFKTEIKMNECAIVEGSNGISTPIDEKSTEIDIVKALGLPLVLVVNPKCDSIGDIICAINFIYSNRVNFLGIILNEYNMNSADSEEKYIKELIQQYTSAKILGEIPYYTKELFNPYTFIEQTLEKIDLKTIFGFDIAKLK